MRRRCSPTTSSGWPRCSISPAASRTRSRCCSSRRSRSRPRRCRCAIRCLLGILAIASATLLVAVHLPLPWSRTGAFALPCMYKVGVWSAIVAGMMFLALYTARLSKEARLMSAALAATELVLAREQRLHALDGLAAAAAHELGTPLATIALVTKELEHEATEPSRTSPRTSRCCARQAERCREILRKLTRSPSDQDPHHVSLPLTQLIQEAAQPYQSRRDPRSTSPSRPFATGSGSEDADLREPIGQRRPGVIYRPRQPDRERRRFRAHPRRDHGADGTTGRVSHHRCRRRPGLLAGSHGHARRALRHDAAVRDSATKGSQTERIGARPRLLHRQNAAGALRRPRSPCPTARRRAAAPSCASPGPAASSICRRTRPRTACSR